MQYIGKRFHHGVKGDDEQGKAGQGSRMELKATKWQK